MIFMEKHILMIAKKHAGKSSASAGVSRLSNGAIEHVITRVPNIIIPLILKYGDTITESVSSVEIPSEYKHGGYTFPEDRVEHIMNVVSSGINICNDDLLRIDELQIFSPEDYQKIAEELKQRYGPEIMWMAASAYADEHYTGKPCILDGVRYYGALESARREGHFLVYLHVDESELIRRIVSNNLPIDTVEGAEGLLAEEERLYETEKCINLAHLQVEGMDENRRKTVDEIASEILEGYSHFIE